MYQANIILSIECILYSNGFYISQRVFIIHLNYDNLFDWKKAKKERYDLPRECILSFSNGFHNSCRNYSHSILHNPSRRRESFRLKQNRGTSYIYTLRRYNALKGAFFSRRTSIWLHFPVRALSAGRQKWFFGRAIFWFRFKCKRNGTIEAVPRRHQDVSPTPQTLLSLSLF